MTIKKLAYDANKMRVSGPTTDLIKLLSNLNPQRLAEVVADLLAIRGHSDIKIVDGPGDGCRDIHSVDKKNEAHITQCKFLSSAAKAVSSREIGELPLGMVKLGYKQGMFVTTGRISPQSKREFLDNYPGFSLDFLEGTELGAEILRNVLLRAIWFDGETLDRISYAVSVPVLLRDLEKDKPIPINSLEGDLKIKDQNQIDIRLNRTHMPSFAFAPYRSPKRKTMSEGWWSTITSGELLITRTQQIDEVENLRKDVARFLLSKAAETWPEKTSMALRMGSPTITPLKGRHAGARIELKMKPLTFVRHKGLIQSEYEWLIPSQGSRWYPPAYVNSSMAEWVRWYNPQDALCLDLNLFDVPSERDRGIVEEQRAYRMHRWNESIFAFLQKESLEMLMEAEGPEPSEQLSWFEGKILCCWFIESSSPFRSILVEAEDENLETEPSPFEPDPVEIQKANNDLKERLNMIGAEILDPVRARYAYAFLLHDPLPNTDKIVYRSVDLLYNFDDIPSPISPSSRRLKFVSCWLLENNHTDEWYDSSVQYTDDLSLKYSSLFEIKLVYDTKTISGTYAVLYIEYLPEVHLENTDVVLTSVLDKLSPLIDDADRFFCNLNKNARRATEKFWGMEIGMAFSTT